MNVIKFMLGVAAGASGIMLTPPILHAAAPVVDAVPTLTPPPANPRDIEGVWKPGTGGGPPPQNRGAKPTGTGGGPGGGGAPQVANSGLVCAPRLRLNGGGGGMSTLVVQGPKEIVMIAEEDQDVRKIYLTNHHPKNLIPQPSGNSIGHWEGDTLVVDTIAVSDGKGKDSGQHIVEHIRKVGTQLVDEAVTTTDSGTSQQTLKSDWRPDLQVWENICEEGYSKFKIVNGKLDDTNS